MRQLLTDPDDVMNEAYIQASDELSEKNITHLTVGEEEYNKLHKQKMIDILNETGYGEYAKLV